MERANKENSGGQRVSGNAVDDRASMVQQPLGDSSNTLLFENAISLEPMEIKSIDQAMDGTTHVQLGAVCGPIHDISRKDAYGSSAVNTDQ